MACHTNVPKIIFTIACASTVCDKIVEVDIQNLHKQSPQKAWLYSFYIRHVNELCTSIMHEYLVVDLQSDSN